MQFPNSVELSYSQIYNLFHLHKNINYSRLILANQAVLEAF